MVESPMPFDDSLHGFMRTASDDGALYTDQVFGMTTVLRYADIDRLARDPRLVGVGLTMFNLMGITSGPLREWYSGLMFTTEGESHDRLRSLVSKAFTPRSVEALRVDTAVLAKQELDAIAEAGEGDLIESFRLLSMRVMCRLLGVPEDDVPVFGRWADALSPIFAFMDDQQIAAANDAIGKMLDYVRDLADRRRTDPRGDVITALLAAEDEGDKLTHEELVAMVANLLVAGHDTTTSQLGCSLLTILRFPNEAARVREEPALIQSAVEETIRFEPSIAGVPRTVLEEIEVAGTTLPPGSLVILATAAANREPGVWDEPDRFDVTRFNRKGGPKLLSFGAGTHFCLGAALARLTVQEVVKATIDAGPELTLAVDPSTIEWRSVLGRAPARLPVASSVDG